LYSIDRYQRFFEVVSLNEKRKRKQKEKKG